MCGIIGLLLANEEEFVNQMLFDGLTVLQHRGQDAAGIVTAERTKKLHLRKDNGLVKDVFQTHHMIELRGNLGLGHVRYPTAGSSSCAEAQPLYTNHPYGICVAHNGNLTNTDKLITYMEKYQILTRSYSLIFLLKAWPRKESYLLAKWWITSLAPWKQLWNSVRVDMLVYT